MAQLKRCLGFTDFFCIALNAIIGSGIFLFPGILAQRTGPSSILVFALCGLLLTTVALCYTELGGMFDGNGGSALYAKEAFGPGLGFAVAWIAWTCSVLSWAAVASFLASHFSYFHPIFHLPLAEKLVAAFFLALFGALNYCGVQLGASAVKLLTVFKILPLALFVLCGLFFVKAGNYRPFFAGEGSYGPALFLALWALQGFEVTSVPAGESSNPQQDIPLATVASLLCACLLYAAIQAVAVGAYPALPQSPARPLADAAASFLGSWGGALLAAGGIVSMIGFVAGSALGAPRYLAALASDFARLRLEAIHPRFHTPYRAILVTTASAILLIAFLDSMRLIDLSNLAVVSQYFSSCLALCLLRWKRPEAPRPFRLPWAWAIAPAGCVISAWLATQVSSLELALAVGLLVLGYLTQALHIFIR